MLAFPLSLFITITPVHAGFENGPVQSLSVFSGSWSLSSSLAVRASYYHFWLPKTNETIYFTYVGPVIKWERGWVSPQIGTAKWFDGDALNLSVWGGTTIRKKTDLFLELDGYVAADHPIDLYSYCAADQNFGPFNIGLQCEGVNTNMTFGPHIGATAKPVHLEIQYYLDPNTDPNGVVGAIRFLAAINGER